MAARHPNQPVRLAITGASEAFGQCLARHLQEDGGELIVVDADSARRQDAIAGEGVHRTEISVPPGVDALVAIHDGGTADQHLARSTQALVAAARSKAVPTVIHLLPAPPLERWRGVVVEESQSRERPCEFNLYVPPSVLDSSGVAGRSGFASSVRDAFRPAADAALVARFLSRRGWLNGHERVLGKGQQDNLFYKATARSVDLGFAVAVLLGFWWLLLGIMAAIRLDSPGPAIFAQTRVGRRGRPFTCYKFRTMSVGTPNVATHEVAAGNVTRLGGFLRRTKLDELPQVWNLLRGELSLVGPRPCLPSQTELVSARQAAGVLEVRPGITGLAQVHRVDMSDPQWLATYDSRYVGLQSLSTDWRIIIATALGKGNQDRVRA